jgi:hypothetical protein
MIRIGFVGFQSAAVAKLTAKTIARSVIRPASFNIRFIIYLLFFQINLFEGVLSILKSGQDVKESGLEKSAKELDFKRQIVLPDKNRRCGRIKENNPNRRSNSPSFLQYGNFPP